MTPRPVLRVVAGGCQFQWVTAAARAEAIAQLASCDPEAVFELDALIGRLEAGGLRANTDFKRMQTSPTVLELRLESTRPRLRLYFAEWSTDGGACAVGLLLARKPGGAVAEQRAAQNAQIEEARVRLECWERLTG